MAYEVPLDILGKRFVLLLQLLRMALCEDALPAAFVDCLYHLGGMILAHCHQLNALWQ